MLKSGYNDMLYQSFYIQFFKYTCCYSLYLTETPEKKTATHSFFWSKSKVSEVYCGNLKL